jgi:hypothetical protein
VKAQQKQRVVYRCDSPTHIGQDNRRSEREDLVRLRNPDPPTPQLLFARRRGKTIEGIPLAKCLREPLGIARLQVLQALFGIGTLGEKTLILGLG